MKNQIEYKGYIASIEYDPEDEIFFGTVTNLVKDSISFEAVSAADIKKEFHNAVDEYVTMCKKAGGEPETPRKPFTGDYRARLGERLHRRVAMHADRQEMSINDVLKGLIENHVPRTKDMD